MGQLVARGGGAVDLDAIDDVATLLAVVRGGRLRERRGALRRLVRWAGDKRASDEIKMVTDALDEIRDVEIEFDVAALRRVLPGGARAMRGDDDAWRSWVTRFEDEIRAYWDEHGAREPLSNLSGFDRARLFLRLRQAPPAVVAHVGAICDDSAGELRAHARRDVLTAARFAGDPRLVPSLIHVLEGRSEALVREAARALARIDDPRVLPALRAAHAENRSDESRLILAGAVALAGDARGRDEVAAALEHHEKALRIATLEALEHLGTPEEAEAIIPYLSDDDPRVRVQAVETLARIGDSRALAPLERCRRDAEVASARAAAEEAIASIAARMELRGEEPIVPDPDETKDVGAAEDATIAPFRARLRAYWNYVVGTWWFALGSLARATARWEFAAAQRPGWAQPLIAMGLALGKRREHAQALNAFRRAMAAERSSVERNPIVAASVARSFLRRAEEVEEGGRHDIARGLVSEVLALDLRRAPSAVRFELRRLADSLARRSA